MIARTLNLLGLIGALVPMAMAQFQPRVVEANNIAASVNGWVITKNQVWVLIATEELLLTKRFPNRGAEFDRAFREASDKLLAELIEREKRIQGAKTLGVQVGDQQVDARIAREINDNYGGNRDKFEIFLRSRRTTMKAFRRYMHDELLEDAILRRQGKKK